MKRILILFLLIIAIGIPAIEANGKETAQEVTRRTGELDLTAAKVKYAGGAGTGNPTKEDIVDSTEGWKWYCHKKTLVLEGIDLTADATKVLSVPDGTTIILRGNNKVTGTYNGDDSCYGLYADGALTITGEWTDKDFLTIKSGDSLSQYTVSSIGLYTTGDFTMQGGCVTAIGGAGKFSKGISVKKDMIMSDGSLFGRGGPATIGSGGLWMTGNNVSVTVTGGVINLEGGQTSLGSSHGLYGDVCNVRLEGGDFTATGGVGHRNSFGVHILPSAAFSCVGGNATLKGDAMAINVYPYLEGEYEYRAGRVEDLQSCTYLSLRLAAKGKGEAELG